jgi:hypothetical protein
MNISQTETPSIVVAKICGCGERSRKVSYALVDQYHNLCLDKKDIVLSELNACERLLKYTKDTSDKETIKKEIAEIKMALDLLT